MKINHQKSELYFLLLLLAGIFIVTYFIFRPFLFALILAIVIATIFDPLHSKVLTLVRGKKSIGALLSTICVLIVVIVPLSFLSVQVFREATNFYSSLVENSSTASISRDVTTALENLALLSPIPIEFSIDIKQYMREGLNWLLQRLGPIFANVAHLMLSTFVFLVALYYLFKDGHKLNKALISVSPLQDMHDKAIIHKLSIAINSVTQGSLAIALAQGILTGIGFAIFGVPNAVLWGSVAAMSAIVPGLGTTLVILPAIFYLYFMGSILPAVGLLVWGVVAVGLVDNILGPFMVERGMKLHPFLILLSILGGIGFFGPLGFLLGPIVLSLLFASLEIYAEINNEHSLEK